MQAPSQLERAGPKRPCRVLAEKTVEKRDRLAMVARQHECKRQLEAAAAGRSSVVVGREPPGELEQLRGVLRSSPAPGETGGFLQAGGDLFVRPFAPQRKMASALFGAGSDFREPAMHRATLCRENGRRQHRSDEGMHEPNAIASNLDEIGLARPSEALARGRTKGLLQEVDRRIREESGGEHRLSGAFRQLLEA